MSNSVQPHRWQPTRLPRPWDSPGKNTGVGCHFLLQCMKVKSESEVAQLCPTLSDPMDCSLRGSSVHGISQARVLEWGAIAFSEHKGWDVTRTSGSTLFACYSRCFLSPTFAFQSPIMKRISFLGVSSKRSCRSSQNCRQTLYCLSHLEVLAFL